LSVASFAFFVLFSSSLSSQSFSSSTITSTVRIRPLVGFSLQLI
jgi:hypothetical protein